MQSVISPAEATPAQTLLLDECVTRRVSIDTTIYQKFGVVHSVEVKGLGWGAKDEKIFSYLLRNKHLTFVTADREFYNICVHQNIATAFCAEDEIVFHSTNTRLRLGTRLERHRRPPLIIHAKNQSQKFFRKLTRRIMSLLTVSNARIQEKRLLEKSKCLTCGLQCRNPARLMNHVKNDHAIKKSKIIVRPSPCTLCGVQCRSARRLEKHIMYSHEGVPRKQKPETPIVGPTKQCICGVRCKGYLRLRNHVITSHNAELAQWRTFQK